MVSVIVPIFNVENYLRPCIQSIINQTYKDLEIILIDDGSTDSSGTIAREYVNLDSRVVFVQKSNGGLSSARNAGLDIARGEWIYFIDSDDVVPNDYIAQLVEIATNFNVEIVRNDNILRHENPEPASFSPNDIKKFTPDTKNIIFGGCVWNMLFSKKILDKTKIRFLEGLIHEDEAFLYMIMPMVGSFVRFSGSEYGYRTRSDSIIGIQWTIMVRSYDLIEIFRAIYKFYKQNDLLYKFGLPYWFLYGVNNFKNREEYLCRAREAFKSMDIPKELYMQDSHMKTFLSPHSYPDYFLYWLNYHFLIERIQRRSAVGAKIIKGMRYVKSRIFK